MFLERGGADAALLNSFWDGRLGGARAFRVQIRASRPNHWLHYLVWKTGFRRDAENGNRDGRAPHSALRIPNSALETVSFPEFILG